MIKRPDALLAEWAYKAEQDYITAEAMAKKRKLPVPDVVGFHCQQCIEKYLKAYLVLHKKPFPRTHDLIDILELLVSLDPLIESIRSDLRLLNPFSTIYRYPGESLKHKDAVIALKSMRRVRKLIREKLGLRSTKQL